MLPTSNNDQTKQLLNDFLHSLRTSLTVLRYEKLSAAADEEISNISRMMRMVQFLIEPTEASNKDNLHVFEALQALSSDERVVIEFSELRAVTDSELFTQAADEIITNALNFSDGEVYVSIHDTKPYTTIRIEDDGPGIPTSSGQDVLLPFVRLDRDRLAGKSGSGLGLTYAAAIAQLLGGKLSFISSAEGTTMFLQIKNHAKQ